MGGPNFYFRGRNFGILGPKEALGGLETSKMDSPCKKNYIDPSHDSVATLGAKWRLGPFFEVRIEAHALTCLLNIGALRPQPPFSGTFLFLTSFFAFASLDGPLFGILPPDWQIPLQGAYYIKFCCRNRVSIPIRSSTIGNQDFSRNRVPFPIRSSSFIAHNLKPIPIRSSIISNQDFVRTLVSSLIGPPILSTIIWPDFTRFNMNFLVDVARLLH